MHTDNRPISLDRAEFDAVSRRIFDACGIKLVPGKEELVRSRLGRRVRELGLEGLAGYLAHVDSDRSGREMSTMVDLLTTNTTQFFRERHHFDFLRERLPRNGGPNGRLRIWSAGCSTGQEPYTIAMLVRDQLGERSRCDTRILGTDISSTALAKAKAGEYTQADGVGRDVPKAYIDRYFTTTGEGASATYRVEDRVRMMVRFAKLNLMDPWPMQGPFDAIFCRNVMIYFDKATQRELARRFCELLAPGGYLFIGHSESLPRSPELHYVQPAVYAK